MEPARDRVVSRSPLPSRFPSPSLFGRQIVVEHASAPIKSLELQLIRVESVAHAEGVARDGRWLGLVTVSWDRQPLTVCRCVSVGVATEIQNVQIGWGDVCRQLAIPIYMIFPRLFTCPTMLAPSAFVRPPVDWLLLVVSLHRC